MKIVCDCGEVVMAMPVKDFVHGQRNIGLVINVQAGLGIWQLVCSVCKRELMLVQPAPSPGAIEVIEVKA